MVRGTGLEPGHVIDLRSQPPYKARFGAPADGRNRGKADEPRTLQKTPSVIMHAKPAFKPSLLPVWATRPESKVCSRRVGGWGWGGYRCRDVYRRGTCTTRLVYTTHTIVIIIIRPA
jgi:hypothetical protein